MQTFIRYIEVYFTFALVDCVFFYEDNVKSRFCSIHFTVILAGLKKVVRYPEDLVKSRFYCILNTRRSVLSDIQTSRYNISNKRSVLCDIQTPRSNVSNTIRRASHL